MHQNQRGSVVRTVLLPNVSLTVTCYVSPLRSPQLEAAGVEGGLEDMVVAELGDVVVAMEELVGAAVLVTQYPPPASGDGGGSNPVPHCPP